MNPKELAKGMIVSKRTLVRLKHSEAVCRELRFVLTKRSCEVGSGDWTPVVNHLVAWLRVAPKKEKYERA